MCFRIYSDYNMSGLCGRETHVLVGALQVVLRWKLDGAAKVLVAGYSVIIRVYLCV